MDKLKIHLENCYGIKKLKHDFDFTKSKTHIIYAPNGVMKSSFAKTLDDIAFNLPSKDRIFKDRTTHRDVKVDGRDAEANEIFVIQRMKDVDFKEASTILANETLKEKYDSLNIKLNEFKSEFLNSLQEYFKLKNNQIEIEIGKIYGKEIFEVLESLETQVNNIVAPLYSNIIYTEIFNDKVLKFLESKDFKSKIKEYIAIYDKLVNENTTLFQKGSFNHYNADTVTKSLKDNNFFAANHKVKINGQEIDDITHLEELIQIEKDKVLKDPKLASKFNEIDKSLNSNNELRKFRTYIENNQEIIKEFVDLKNFSKKLFENYLGQKKDIFNVLLKQYKETNTQRAHLIQEAAEEQDAWVNVLDIFKRRFTVPFKIKIKNQKDVILKNEPASLIFTYTDGQSTEEMGGIELQQSLSTGEQRVFYLLNIIFQIETRRAMNIKQLIVVDDIADSFDYKNKYAIIEYLKDVAEDENFKLIILTHNFDFYKTIKSRLGSPTINYEGNWIAIKKTNEISLVVGEKRDIFPTLRSDFDKCDLTLIACIPFVRNLIEFSIGTDNKGYHTLTSLLHLKPRNDERNIDQTIDLTKNTLFDIFNDFFSLATTTQNPNDKIFDLIMSKSNELIASNLDLPMDIKGKICLSLAIRLKAEEYMLGMINDVNFKANILKKQTGQIVGQFKKEFADLSQEIGILDRVNIMTPENIHVNSFMYEPLMDLSDDHLKTLYNDILALNN